MAMYLIRIIYLSYPRIIQIRSFCIWSYCAVWLPVIRAALGLPTSREFLLVKPFRLDISQYPFLLSRDGDGVIDVFSSSPLARHVLQCVSGKGLIVILPTVRIRLQSLFVL